MLAGLFLSKFDREGLDILEFTNFSEAYNAIGYALSGKPASIKNYMQEFDPLFPNPRKGWHKRKMRDHCRDMYDRFGDLSLQEFCTLLSHLLLPSSMPLPTGMDELTSLEPEKLENETFSKRLITGAAAEGFFESNFPMLANFTGHELTNVTRFGCGFDFRVQPADSLPFLAVEVKGISGAAGSILMTRKEHQVAEYLRNRYFLCVVRNFAEEPVLSLYQNPLEQGLHFTSRESQQTTVTWHARISA